MSSLGDLTVKISADYAQFQSDMGKVHKSTTDATKGMIGGFDNFGKAVSGATKILSGLATVGAVTALAGMAKSAIDSADEIGKMSQKVGLSVKELSALKYAGSLADVSIEQLGVGMKQLSKNLVEAEAGSKAQVAAFKALGIETRNTDGTLKTNNQVILEVADAFAGMEDANVKTTMAMKIFGKSGADLIPLLNAGSDGIEEMRKEAERLGLVLDEKTTKAAEEFNDNLTRLESKSKGLAMTLAEVLLPQLVEVTDKLNQMAQAKGPAGKLQAWIDTGWGDEGPGFAWSTDEDKKAWAQRTGKFHKANIHSATGDEVTQVTTAANTSALDKYLKSLEDQEKKTKKTAKTIKDYTKVVAELTDARKLADPVLTDENRQMLQLDMKYADLIKTYPKHQAELLKNLELDKQQITLKKELSAQLEIQKEQIKWFLANAEDYAAIEIGNEDIANFGSGGLKSPKSKKEKNSLMGDVPGLLLGDEVTSYDEANKEKLKLEKEFNDEMMSMKIDAAEQSVELLRSMAGENIAVQMGLLLVEKSLAIARIITNTEVAASAALAIPVVGEARAAAIRAMGAVSIGIVAASAVIEGIQTISGKRALGGKVAPYSTYLVGERGPELMTTGSNGGYVTPNSALGGSTYAPVFQIDARGSNMTRAEMESIAKQATERGKAEILNSMNRGGSFAFASGRR